MDNNQHLVKDNLILVGQAGCGKSLHLMNEMKKLRVRDESFGYITGGCLYHEFSNIVKTYRVNGQVYSTFNIDPLVYLPSEPTEECLIAIQALGNHFSDENRYVSIPEMSQALSTADTFLMLCDNLHIKLSEQMFHFFDSMKYLACVPNTKEWIFDLGNDRLCSRHKGYDSMIACLMNAVMVVNQVKHVILDEVNNKQYAYLQQAGEMADTLKITTQCLYQVNEIKTNFNKEFELFIFRTQISADDMSKYHLTEIKEKIAKLNVGEFLQILV